MSYLQRFEIGFLFCAFSAFVFSGCESNKGAPLTMTGGASGSADSLASTSTIKDSAAITPFSVSGASFSAVERGENRTVWASTNYETDVAGNSIPYVHRYEEVANGINYQDPQSGEWMESKELIEISSAGGAQAIHGQHKVYFPYDIYDGVIELVTPDGQHLKSRPLEIAYTDDTNNVMIAELRHSVGQILPSGNQVIYTNAFTDFEADLVCTYRRSGFESDLVFRQAPPVPEAFGLDSKASHLELLTEFFDTPEPEQISSIVKPAAPASAMVNSAGNALPDVSLRFGAMQMIRGKAFSIIQTQSNLQTNVNLGGFPWQEPDLAVNKTWATLEGRPILIEAISVVSMNSQLQNLPVANPQVASLKPSERALQRTSSRWLPPKRLARQNSTPLLVAKADIGKQTGLVLDYVTVNLNQTDFTFAGDTTYYMSAGVTFTGNVTIEGGAVIKFPANSNSFIYVDGGTITCQTAPYRPAIFTSKDDNSVGETLSGSTGSPVVGDYACLASENTSWDLHDLRMLYGFWGIYTQTGNASIRDIQVLHSQVGVQYFLSSNCIVRNVLMSDMREWAFEAYGCSIDVEHLTLDQSPQLGFNDFTSTLQLTNCLFTGVPVMPPGGGFNIPYISNSIVVLSTNTGVFQNAGAGNYYLSSNSIYRNIGTTNIAPSLWSELQQKTTFAPPIFSNVTVSVNTTLSPQVQRDVDIPDIGYHYDPIDYLVDAYWFTNTTVTISPGTAIACYNDAGIVVSGGSAISSLGTPTAPVWFTRYSAVQEQALNLPNTNASPGSADIVNSFHATNAPSGLFQFTKFSCPASGGYHLYHNSSSWAYSNLLVEDCEFWSGKNDFSGYNNSKAIINNNLFARLATGGQASGATNSFLIESNNLYWNGSVVVIPLSNSNSWYFFNNAFDHTTILLFSAQSTINGYNAYIGDTNVTKSLNPIASSDVLLTTFTYQAGPLGYFYQPTNSSLINTGSCTANLAGLYHFTTQTNQLKETNSVVDIGYHYVALDALGNPVDTDGDGIPDYLEDANGNGLVDAGESDWQLNNFNGLSGAHGLQVFTPLK